MSRLFSTWVVLVVFDSFEDDNTRRFAFFLTHFGDEILKGVLLIKISANKEMRKDV